MSSLPLSPLSKGDPLPTSADFFNRLIAIVNAAGQPIPDLPSAKLADSLSVRVINASESDIPRFSPVFFLSVEGDLARPLFRCRPATADDPWFAIAQEDLPAGHPGKAVVWGLSFAFVGVSDVAHTAAVITPSAATDDAPFASSASGPLSFLTTPAATGRCFLPVLLGALSYPASAGYNGMFKLVLGGNAENGYTLSVVDGTNPDSVIAGWLTLNGQSFYSETLVDSPLPSETYVFAYLVCPRSPGRSRTSLPYIAVYTSSQSDDTANCFYLLGRVGWTDGIPRIAQDHPGGVARLFKFNTEC